MALKPRNLQDFDLKIPDVRIHGENLVIIRGGSTIIDDRWVVFNDIQIDLKSALESYVTSTSRRLFNNFNDIIYVLITLDKYGTMRVVPNISYSKKAYGDVKVFPDLSDMIPLVMVRVQHDGSAGLTGFNPIVASDIELYQGYGNFTLKGPCGPVGENGATGYRGLTGYVGITGITGETGIFGVTGPAGHIYGGSTGVQGVDGDFVYRYVATDLTASFIALETTVYPGDSVHFVNQSTGPIESASGTIWYFGDGTSLNDVWSPTHVYNYPGIFTVTLTVRGFNGLTDSMTRINYIRVIGPLPTAYQDTNVTGLGYWQDTNDGATGLYQDITGG